MDSGARRINWEGMLTVAALLGLWELLMASKTLDYRFLPAPSGILTEGSSLLTSGELLEHLGHTLRVTLIGWVSACLIGIGLGIGLGLSRTAWRWSMASIEVMRAVPPVSLVPVALLVFGFSIRMELTLVIYVSAWPVIVNTIDGMRQVPDGLRDVARTLKMSRLQTVAKIVLPAAVPSILVGMQLALSLSLVLAVVAEMVGNPSGLGSAVVAAQQALQPEQMFAYVLAVGLLGIGLNTAFRFGSALALPSLAGAGVRATS